MDIESKRAVRPASAWESSAESWPAEAQDACAPEGGVPVWLLAEMSIADQWAYAAEASS